MSEKKSAPRSIGSATLSFGLVSVPVRIFSAGQPQSTVSFNLLHAKCGSRLKQEYQCSHCEKPVPREDMVKGHEYAKDQYVRFTAEELKALEAKGDGSMVISEFVPWDAVDPRYLEKTYYLAPDKGGDKAYKLLASALSAVKMVGIAQYISRGKQHLILLRAVEGVLVYHQLLYAAEVRDLDEVPVKDTKISKDELVLAMRLIEHLAKKSFDLGAYEDESEKAMRAAVKSKIETGAIGEVAETPQPAVADLMTALQASLPDENDRVCFSLHVSALVGETG